MKEGVGEGEVGLEKYNGVGSEPETRSEWSDVCVGTVREVGSLEICQRDTV